MIDLVKVHLRGGSLKILNYLCCMKHWIGFLLTLLYLTASATPILPEECCCSVEQESASCCVSDIANEPCCPSEQETTESCSTEKNISILHKIQAIQVSPKTADWIAHFPCILPTSDRLHFGNNFAFSGEYIKPPLLDSNKYFYSSYYYRKLYCCFRC